MKPAGDSGGSGGTDQRPKGLDGSTSPVCWRTLIADEAAEEWQTLREWVEQLRERFPHAARLPLCWFQHNDLVELLSALRDYERGCFAANAAPTGAVDWHRAFRDVELRMEIWIKRFTCGVAGREHRADTSEEGWKAFVAADVQARKR